MKKLLFLLICSVAMGESVEQTISLDRFTAGELSPLVHAVVTHPRYRLGAKTLENMMVRPQGPIQRRPGTKYIASVKDATDETRIIPFSDSNDFIVEIGDAYARFYRAGAQIVNTYAAWVTSTAYVIGDLVTNSGSYYRCLVAHTSGTFATDLSASKWVVSAGATDLAHEIVTPWDANDVMALQYATAEGSMRIVHGDYEPRKLERSDETDDSSWTIAAIGSTTGPFLDENRDTTWTLTSNKTTGTDATITSTDDLFESTHVGALFQISHIIVSVSVSKEFWANTYPDGTRTSSEITIRKYQLFDVITDSDWRGKLHIQRENSLGTWESIHIHANRYGNALQYAGREMERTSQYRLRMIGQYVTDHNFRNDEKVCNATISTRPMTVNGTVELTARASATSATADVKIALGGTTATWRWAEGAWSDYQGWPRTVEYHEQRILYAGTKLSPETVWASIIAEEDSDYDDFTANIDSDAEGNLGGPDDIAWSYKFPGMGTAQWLRSGKFLFCGTSKGVMMLGQPGRPITPNFPPIARMQNYNACAFMQPASAAAAILYVEKGAQKIRELGYTHTRDTYIAPDMTALAEHITGDGIVDIAFQSRPDPILWTIRSDGVLLSFTYQPDTMAWARHDTGATGLFKSVAAIPGSGEDELWHVIGRTVDANAVKFIEQSQSFDWGTDQNDCWFVDSGINTLTGLDHLEGETVALWGDGRPVGTFTVALGIISPSGSYTNTTVGLPYTSVFETMPLVAQDKSGNFVNSLWTNIHYVVVDFYKTLGCHVGVDGTNNEDWLFSDDEFATTLDVVTEIKDAPEFEGTERAPTLHFSETDPIPLTIRGVKTKIEVEYE